MYVPSYWHFNVLLPSYSNFYGKLLNPPPGTSLNESFNKAFAWSPKPVFAFCVPRWHSELKTEYLKFRVKCFSWVCIFLCSSCHSFSVQIRKSKGKSRPRTLNKAKPEWHVHKALRMPQNTWRCPRGCSDLYRQGSHSFPGSVGFRVISEGLVASWNILYPDLLSQRQERDTQIRTSPEKGCRYL